MIIFFFHIISLDPNIFSYIFSTARYINFSVNFKLTCFNYMDRAIPSHFRLETRNVHEYIKLVIIIFVKCI